MSGGSALPGGPGVIPPIKPFQKSDGPAGDDSGMKIEGRTRVDGGAKRGFWRSGAGVTSEAVPAAGWKGVSGYVVDSVGFLGFGDCCAPADDGNA